jgi:outer membrane protein assembly factor BamB
MIDASPIVAEDGAIVVGATKGSAHLMAFTPTGGKRWETSLDDYEVRATPALRRDGRLVVIGTRFAGSRDHRTGGVREKDSERAFLLDPSTGRITRRSAEYVANGFGLRSPLVDGENIYYAWGTQLFRFDQRAVTTGPFAPETLWNAIGNITGGPGWNTDCFGGWLVPCLSLPKDRPPAVLAPSPSLSRLCGDIAGTGILLSYRVWPATRNGWTKDLKALTTAAFGASGRMYLGLWTPGGVVAAFEQDGSELWSVKLDGDVLTPPAIGSGGISPTPLVCQRQESRRRNIRTSTRRADNVYVATSRNPRRLSDNSLVFRDGSLYALDYRGRVRWRRDLEGQPGPPVVLRMRQSELIIVATDGGSALSKYLKAYRENGSLAWTLRLDAAALGSPAVANGTIYVATKTSLYAVR